MVEEKVSKKVLKAEKARQDLINANRILRSQRIIANSSLPKHKQKKFDDLATQAMVKQFNAEQAFEASVRKLSNEEKFVLARRIGMING